MTNIERTHPGAKELLSKGGIAVARSLIPGALSAVDKTMEETFMRFAKSPGMEPFVVLIYSPMLLLIFSFIAIQVAFLDYTVRRPSSCQDASQDYRR